MPAAPLARYRRRSGRRRHSAAASTSITSAQMTTQTMTKSQISALQVRMPAGPADRAPTASRDIRPAPAAAATSRHTRPCRSPRHDRGGRAAGGRGAVFGRARLHVVVAAGRSGLRRQRPEGPDVAGQLPDLVRRQPVAEGRHAAGPAVADRDEDRDRDRAVAPPAIHQRRSERAAAIGMAAVAVEPGVEPLALAELIGVGLRRVAECAIDRRAARRRCRPASRPPASSAAATGGSVRSVRCSRLQAAQQQQRPAARSQRAPHGSRKT